MNPTLYDVLGVARDASPEEIRAAWREAADRFEPGGGSSIRQFKLFNEAAEVLLDPEKRAAYDATLPAEATAARPRLDEALRPVDEAADPATEEASAAPLDEASAPAGEAPEEDAVPASPPIPGPPVPGTARAASQVTSEPAGRPDVRAPRDEAARDEAPRDEAPRDEAPRDEAPRDEAEEPGRRVSFPVFAALAALAAVAVLLGAIWGTKGFLALQEEREAEGYQGALNRAPAAAESAAAAVLSYDHETLEADRDAAAKFLSDGYREEYLKTFDVVMDTAPQTKATVTAEVLASAPMSSGKRDAERVPVLLFVNQKTVSAANSGEPSVALNRVRFDMVEADGSWLVDGITSY